MLDQPRREILEQFRHGRTVADAPEVRWRADQAWPKSASQIRLAATRAPPADGEPPYRRAGAVRCPDRTESACLPTAPPEIAAALLHPGLPDCRECSGCRSIGSNSSAPCRYGYCGRQRLLQIFELRSSADRIRNAAPAPATPRSVPGRSSAARFSLRRCGCRRQTDRARAIWTGCKRRD